MADLIQSLVDYLSTNLTIALLIVFLIATGEAVFILGFFVPSTAVLVGAGTLVGLGKLPFWPVFLVCTVGAVAGDAISYWIGYVFKDRLRTVWPFSRYTSLLAKGEAFFRDHGAKSIFLGRFVPGVKAVVPGIAGMMSMDLGKFTAINVVSAFVWSAAHIVPGMAAGAALDALGEVSTRLMILAAIALGLLLVAVMAARWTVIALRPLLAGAHERLIAYAATHDSRVFRWFARTFDPDNPRAFGMAVASLSIMAAILIFAVLVSDLGPGRELSRADQAVSNLFSSLRTATGDRLMLTATMLGDAFVTVSVTAAVVLWLVFRNAPFRAIGVFTAVAAASIFVPLLKAILQRSRPEAYPGSEIWSFPSGHATIAVVLYGVIAVLVTHNWSLRRKGFVFSLAAGLIAAIALSRIYLGAHWPSDVLGGVAFGLAIVGAFSFVFGHLRREAFGQVELGLVAVLALALSGSTHYALSYARQQQQFAPTVLVRTLPAAEWAGAGWQELPVYRIDLDGDRSDPLILQSAASAEDLRRHLAAYGWREPVAWSVQSASAFARGDSAAGDLPSLPRFHDGREPVMTLMRTDGPAERWLLRLWPSGTAITDVGGKRDVLVGSVVLERLRHPFGQFTLATIDRTASFHPAGLRELLPGARLEPRPPGLRPPSGPALYVILVP